MTPFWPFFAQFLLASAVTALVQTLVREPAPGRAGIDTLRLFLYIVGGILLISLLVYALEGCAGIRPPSGL